MSMTSQIAKKIQKIIDTDLLRHAVSGTVAIVIILLSIMVVFLSEQKILKTIMAIQTVHCIILLY